MAGKPRQPTLRPYEKWTPDVVRQRIQVSAIVGRLVKHIAGKVKMSATQVRAAEILLRKAVPDLASVEHSGELGHRVRTVSAEPLTQDEWDKQYGASLPH